MAKPKHILVIRLSAMGDVAMSVPVLRAFTQQYPDVKLTVLTRAFFKPFFRDLKNVSVFVADVKEAHKGILGLYRLSRALKSLNIDAIADLHNVLRSKLLKTFLLSVKSKTIDKGRAEKKALVQGKLFRQLKTTHQRYADVFTNLGYKVDLSNPSFPEPKILSPDLSTYITDSHKKTIGIAPFAAYKGKMYPLEQMETVIETLSKTYNIILFGGGTSEIKILNTFEAKFENTKSGAGKLSLNEELDIISNLDVMLAMDSGNAHIAAMLGVKVITIWGVTHPYAGFAPFNQPEHNNLLANRENYPLLPTSIYGNTYPDNYETIAGSIDANTVIDRIKELV